MKPLTNFEIDEHLKDVSCYVGSFSKDMLPPRKGDECVVINLENYADGGGTHWVCCFRNEYLDSFGLEPPDTVVKWMRGKQNEKIFYNSSKIQKDESVLCGYYCIYFIREWEKGRKLADVLLDFNQWPSDFNEMNVVRGME